MMVASNCFGAVSHPICLDYNGSNCPTVWEKRGGESSKQRGYSGKRVPNPLHLSHDKCCKISIDTLGQPTYHASQLTPGATDAFRRVG